MDKRKKRRPGGKLKFSKEEKSWAKEKAQTGKLDHKVGKTEAKAEKYEKKRDKYHDKQPTRKKHIDDKCFDEAKGRTKSRLRFDKEAIPMKEANWNKQKKKSAPRKMAGTAATAGVNKLHSKVYEAEQENVGVQVGHKVELFSESLFRGGKKATRSAYRFARNTPYRKEAKFEAKSVKARSKLEYQKALRDNPKTRSNPISRLWQKRNIQKQYADARKAAKRSKKSTKEAARAVKKTGSAVVNTIRKNPILLLKLAILFLIIIMMVALISMCGALFSGGSGYVGASTYVSEDGDMLAAEAAYAGMESALQHELDHYSTLHPGYNEYHYDFDEIGHDPYALISILSAMYEGPWTLNEVRGTLDMLFERQYTLTETVIVEVRYRTRTSTYTDPVTGESYETTYEVPYNYYICTVTLDNSILSHLPVYIMGEEGLSRYALYMKTLGNRPDLFPGHLYPGASTMPEYTRYDIPPEYLSDETFAAIIREAEKYLGFPYVFGGSNPTTSFDCSGFVSWVLNHTGWDVGRLGARGLYSICTPVPPANAMPGDLIFFHSTYKTQTPGISHVGIYVGDGMMLHCGNPIKYVSIETSYWQSHFYGYARLPEKNN